MISASVNIAPIISKFDRMRKTDRRRVFAAARRPMREDIRDHAKTQSGPTGGKWPGRAASTQSRRGNRRKLLGRLPAAYAITIGADFIRALWRVRWSGVVARGGRVGHGSRLPARDFAYASRKLRRTLRDMLKAAVLAAWKR